MRSIFAAAVVGFCVVGGAQAQVNPKREACLSEAREKGLWSTGSKMSESRNIALAEQRKEFMKGCMKRH